MKRAETGLDRGRQRKEKGRRDKPHPPSWEEQRATNMHGAPAVKQTGRGSETIALVGVCLPPMVQFTGGSADYSTFPPEETSAAPLGFISLLSFPSFVFVWK